MARIILRTEVAAPVERCFDLSRSIELHTQSTSKTQERAVAGKTSGLIGLGESITWRAKHFGVWQELTSRITAFEYPNFFVDEMQRGIFKKIYHLHQFERTDTGTVMIDDFQFNSPAGILGTLVDAVVLKRYLTNFLLERNRVIKAIAESGDTTLIAS